KYPPCCAPVKGAEQVCEKYSRAPKRYRTSSAGLPLTVWRSVSADLPYTVRRSSRARRVRVSVDPRAGVEVVLPARAPARAAAGARDRARGGGGDAPPPGRARGGGGRRVSPAAAARAARAGGVVLAAGRAALHLAAPARARGGPGLRRLARGLPPGGDGSLA